MTMRVFECNLCGEPFGAATDDELVRRVRGHFESEHPDVEFDEASERETIAREAYDASDN
jgi:predicted small metal-binding protein